MINNKAFYYQLHNVERSGEYYQITMKNNQGEDFFQSFMYSLQLRSLFPANLHHE